AGKSTLLHSISGLVRPGSGSISYNGEVISGLPPHRIVRMGIVQVPEGRRIFTLMTVQENLQIGAFTRGRSDTSDDIDLVFSLFPVLAEKRSRLGGELSGGQQQMLAIGRALMASPRLLLLDEPSLGLSPVMVQQIGAIIGDISAAGTAVLLVEQNARMALAHATHGYVLETGRVVLDQPASELRRDERVRTFYLGLHGGEDGEDGKGGESGGRATFASLRQRRPERRWAL
ncbi:MAG: ABC transporter ATP-binding protein, partial [Ktedonobacterales bacterium]